MNMGRANYGMAGQQALAGLAERNQATQNLSGLLTNMRGQDVNASLGARQNAIGGYGAGQQGAPEKSWLEKYGPAVEDAAKAYAASDKRLKTEIKDGDDDVDKAMAGLKAYSYRYKDEKFGKGKQVGILAQDLEKSGLGHTVVDTPSGKMVNGAKMSLTNTSMIARLAKRLGDLEQKAS